jgi:hypothetical protein
MSLGQATDPTMQWDAPRALPARLVYAAGILGGGLLMCLVGFWIGRAGTPEERVASAPVPAAQPIRLPTPPTALHVAPDAGSMWTAPATPRNDPPTVTIRPVPGASPPLSANRPASVPPIAAMAAVSPRPTTVTRSTAPIMHGPTAGSSGRILVQTSAGPPDMPAGGATPAIVTARSGPNSGTLTLRNDDATPVEVTLDGNGSRTALVAPGSVLPLTLAPGAYQLQASSHGAASAQSRLSVKANRSYTLLVNRRKEGGKDTLVLIEPIEPATDGDG